MRTCQLLWSKDSHVGGKNKRMTVVIVSKQRFPSKTVYAFFLSLTQATH